MIDRFGPRHNRTGGGVLVFTGLLIGVVLSANTSAVHAQQAPVPTPAAQQAPARPAEPRRYLITEYRVEGNTLLSELDVDRAVYNYLGPGKTEADIEKARDALEKLFQDKGYPTVSTEIPQQQIHNGVVVLKVVERTIGRLRVRGSRYYDLATIKSAAPSLAPGTVPHMPELQRDIVALNQWPDRAVTPTLRAGAAPDTVDVDLDVKDHFPGHANLELNNQQVVGTRPLRVTGTLSYDNLWQRGDSVTLTFQAAPQNISDASVFSGSYLLRLPESDLSLLISYLHSNSNVATVGATNVLGKGDVVGARLIVPLGFAEGFTHSLSAGLDYKHFTDDITQGGTLTHAPVTYVPITLAYQASWADARATTDLLASLVFTFGGPGSGPAAFDNARTYAPPGFALVRIDASRTQTLPHGMQAYAHLTGQLTGEPLIINEQFSLGGMNTVRGYYESETLGDYGAAVQTELRTPPITGSKGGLELNDLRGLAFFDAGTAVQHNPLADTQSSFNLYSAGAGLRMQMLDHYHGEVVVAFPLDDGPDTKAGSPRALFRVYGDF